MGNDLQHGEETEYHAAGCGKRLIGVVVCTVAGTIAGAFGSIAPWLLGLHIIAGQLGQDEPGIIEPILSGGWFFGLFGLLPGLLVGIAYGITNDSRVWIAVAVIAVLGGYATEIAFGYPTSIPALCFYIGAPLATVAFSAYVASRLKIRLGLMPTELARQLTEAEEKSFK